MSKYGFWILLLACVLAIAALYLLEVRKLEKELQTRAETATQHALDARAAQPSAIGRQALEGLREAHVQADAAKKDLHEFFTARDEVNLDFWFPDLRMPWKSAPLPEVFQRQYEIAQDRLRREAKRLLIDSEGPDIAIPLMSPEPIDPKAFANSKALGEEMRRRQREFWVQEHLILAFARQGAWPARALRAGDSAAGNDLFARLRFDVQVYAQPSKVIEVLHAFDSPFVYVTEEGQRVDIAVNAVVDNVSIRVTELTQGEVERFADEPPVLVNFYLTVLDYLPKKGS